MRHTIFVILFLFAQIGLSQVTIEPSSPTINDEITITIDVKQSNDDRANGLLGLTEGVYLWSGAGDADEPFQYGPDGQSDFSQPVPGGEMTSLGNDVWQIVLTPKDYYNIPDGVEVTRLGLLLKNTDGSAQTEDFIQEISAADFVSYTTPVDLNNTSLVSLNDVISFSVTSSSVADIDIQIDEGTGFASEVTGNQVSTLSFDYTVSASVNLKLKVLITNLASGGENFERNDSINLFIVDPVTIENIPSGIKDGINYDPVDDTKVTLVLTAPNKDNVFVVGDFTNWELSNTYQMKKNPGNDRYWLEITGLTPSQEYIFQYWVDGSIKIGDPLADKVADPWNDGFIEDSVYPNLIVYTRTEHGIATVLQTGQTPFSWDSSEDIWTRPAKEDLVIYELLIRDFIGTHNYNDLIDSLSYLKKLGVNAIELMPIMEFDGNDSWGYNPSYFLAPDKYYGTKNDLKNFIQTAHQEGFAVILDMVLNHATGSNPYAAMYWDEVNNRPAADNPWFNTVAKHPFNVFNDFNHESVYTKNLVDTVNSYWITEYHFDGFRFDLSKGFTQVDSGDDVGAWGSYDQSRVDLLTRMANNLWAYDPEIYVILEHFAAGNEETTLANEGMILWGNQNDNYKQALSGENPVQTIGGNDLIRVSYMESHDEERLMFVNENEGESLGNYDITNVAVGLERVKMGAAFFYSLPGPKMMWQFQELGYNLSINTCSDGVTISNDCRVSRKPLPWGSGNLGLYEDELRQKLYNAHSAIINLTNDYSQVFNDGTLTSSLNGELKSIHIEHVDMDVVIIGNFGLSKQSIDPSFSNTGTWYDYFTGNSLDVEDVNAEIELNPGEFHIYTTIENETPEDVTLAPPMIEPVVDQVIDENTILGPIDLTITEGDVSLDNVEITAVGSNSSLLLSSSIEVLREDNTWSIIVTPRIDRTGETDIIIEATDGVSVSTVSFKLTVQEVITSTESKISSSTIVYPNPTSDYLNIKSFESKGSIFIYDMMGKAVYKGPLLKDMVINTSSFKEGIYVIKLNTSTDNIEQKLIISR